MLRFSLLIIFFIGIPSIAYGAIRITEVAWMGTSESQFGEWIELYNDAQESVDLAGWKLYEAGGDTLVFTFTKTIPAEGYLILERTTASVTDPLPSINDESGTFGGSGFSNSGESLVLKNADDETVQTLAFSSGWPAGDSESKQTMQWSEGAWISADQTPGKGISSVSGGIQPVLSSQAVAGSGSWIPPKIEPRVVLTVPKYIYTTITYEYEAQAFLEYGPAYSGGFVWNMGDGTVYKSTSPQPVRHTYRYPGMYSISFGFYKNSYDTKPFFFETVERSVSEPTLVFSVISGKGFQFSNKSSHSIDVSGWTIDLGDRSISLPPLSILAAKATVIMPFSQFGLLPTYTSGVLKTPEGGLIGGDLQVETIITSPQSTRISSPARPSVRGIATTEVEAAEETVTEIASPSTTPGQQKNHTKTIFLGAVLLVVIGLFLLLERFMAQQE